MTKNQIEYQKAIEDHRHNLESESITRLKEEENIKRQKAESLRREVATLQSLFTNLAEFQESKTRQWKNIGETVGKYAGLMG